MVPFVRIKAYGGQVINGILEDCTTGVDIFGNGVSSHRFPGLWNKSYHSREGQV